MRLARRLIVDHLRGLAARGFTRDEAAAETELSYTTISSLSVEHAIEFKRRRPTETSAGIARVEDMRRRKENGETLQQIGAVYNLTRQRVLQILQGKPRTAIEGRNKAAKPRRKRGEPSNREVRCQKVWGCSYKEYLAIMNHRDRPTFAYWSQKRNALQRGIAWEFNLPQWWAIWRDSGHWDERGVAGYVMCRKGDAGPYSPGNVYIATSVQNIRDFYATRSEKLQAESSA